MIQPVRTLVALALLMFGISAQAQFRDMWGTGWNNPVSASLGSSIYWRTMMQTPKGQVGAQSPATSPSAAPHKAPADSRTVTFPAASALIAPRNVAEAMGKDRAHRAELVDAFRQFVEVFEKDAVADKEPRNVARAAAFFIVASYIATTGNTPSEDHANALQKALHGNLLLNPTFQAMTPRHRQELYETLIIHGYLPLYGIRDGEERKSPDQVAMFRDFARQGLKAVIGVTPEQMTFTNTGVALK